ncbi:uncharacterized protein [Petaurus breviceps papuanus]|uniref:uncharacterized protein isoform X3 n=1 Tax=Petaurus breviceps papuanus TaxID=3040969 RepID=UPI0036DF7E2F
MRRVLLKERSWLREVNNVSFPHPPLHPIAVRPPRVTWRGRLAWARHVLALRCPASRSLKKLPKRLADLPACAARGRPEHRVSQQGAAGAAARTEPRVEPPAGPPAPGAVWLCSSQCIRGVQPGRRWPRASSSAVSPVCQAVCPPLGMQKEAEYILDLLGIVMEGDDKQRDM